MGPPGGAVGSQGWLEAGWIPVPPVVPCDSPRVPPRGRNAWALPYSKAFPASPLLPAARVPCGLREEWASLVAPERQGGTGWV